jgi:hypothetical protein
MVGDQTQGSKPATSDGLKIKISEEADLIKIGFFLFIRELGIHTRSLP